MSMREFSAPLSSLSSFLLTQTIQCSTLAAVPQLKGKIYVPGSDAYDARLKIYYSANAALEPWCMVLPETTQDVSKIAQVISNKKCPFGIRSGAHSAWKGSNGVENGITIDFSTDICTLPSCIMTNYLEVT